MTAQQHIDIALVGGGVAGSMAALTLRRAGLDVALIEREVRFRDRIRGEAIHPWGVRLLRDLELQPELDAAGARELALWTRYRDQGPADPYAWTSDFPGSPGEMTVSHVALQNVLTASAEAAGVRVFRPAEARARLRDDGWQIEIDGPGGRTTLQCSLLIGADGRRSGVRRLLGGEAQSDPVHHMMGGTIMRGINLPRDSAHQAFHDAGFAMAFPQNDDIWRVYTVGPTEEAERLRRDKSGNALREHLTALFPPGALGSAAILGPTGWFPNADLVATGTHGPHAFVIGDAAGANDPSQGQGLSMVADDVATVRRLVTTRPLADVPAAFAVYRRHLSEVLRRVAHWAAVLTTESGDRIEELRAQVDRAREIDPTAGGYAAIFALGPRDLTASEADRQRYFGEDIPGATVFGAGQLRSTDTRHGMFAPA